MSNKKRGNGEGSISKRKDGRWVAVISTTRGQNGKKQRKSFYGKTRSEVVEKMKFYTNNTAESEENTDNYTLAEWLELWIREYAAKGIKSSTRENYHAYIFKHIIPQLGKYHLNEVTTNKIQVFYNQKFESGRLDGTGGLSAKTLRNMNNMFHLAMGQALKNDLITKNPCDYVVLPQNTRKEIKILSRKDQQKLLEACDGERLGFAIVFTLFTGVRVGELLGLRWSDVDLQDNQVQINRTYGRRKCFDDTGKKTELIFTTPKTAKSRRIIPISCFLVDEFTKYSMQIEVEKKACGAKYSESGAVFCNELGGHIEPRTFEDFYKRILKKGGIGGYNFHALRHTFATRALEAGIPIKTVSQILGHATVQITMDTYMHIDLNYMRDSMEIISRSLNIDTFTPTEELPQ